MNKEDQEKLKEYFDNGYKVFYKENKVVMIDKNKSIGIGALIEHNPVPKYLNDTDRKDFTVYKELPDWHEYLGVKKGDHNV